MNDSAIVSVFCKKDQDRASVLGVQGRVLLLCKALGFPMVPMHSLVLGALYPCKLTPRRLLKLFGGGAQHSSQPSKVH